MTEAEVFWSGFVGLIIGLYIGYHVGKYVVLWYVNNRPEVFFDGDT